MKKQVFLLIVLFGFIIIATLTSERHPVERPTQEQINKWVEEARLKREEEYKLERKKEAERRLKKIEREEFWKKFAIPVRVVK